MRILDLFSGLRGWSDPFRERGHEVVCVEINPRFPAHHRNVMDFDPSKWGHFDGVLASPPCTSFSLMSIGTHWTHDHEPKTPTAAIGRQLVIRAREIIRQINPYWWLIENPRAKLRKMPCMADLTPTTVWYCRYGDFRAKPTDIWGVPPVGFKFRPECHNGHPDHAAAPRGSRTGTQGMDKYESAKIPRELALDVCLAAEKMIEPTRQPEPKEDR